MRKKTKTPKDIVWDKISTPAKPPGKSLDELRKYFTHMAKIQNLKRK